MNRENVARDLSFEAARDRPIGQSEPELRIDLAACYRLVALYGMTDLGANHITARIPDSDHHILINAYGMLYEEVTASRLYKIDLEGNVVQAPDVPYSINGAGYVIHSAIHGARDDVQCVLHTHTRAGVAVSCMKDGLLPITQTALLVTDSLGYHDYEGPAVSLGERQRLVDNLGDNNFMILRNHGLLTCGRSIPEAFWRMYQFENACKIQVDVMSMQGERTMPSDDSVERVAELMTTLRKPALGNLEWPSLRRRLDRILPGYEQ